MSFYVRGRGFPSPLCIVTASADGIRIRLDDDERPESWVEIGIPLYLLEEYVKAARLHAQGAAEEQVDGNPEHRQHPLKTYPSKN